MRARLQRNNYLAKTSALGGFLKRARVRNEDVEKWAWTVWLKAAIWFARGSLWWITSLVFLAWCALGTFPRGKRVMEEALRLENIGATPSFGGTGPFIIPFPEPVERFLTFLPKRRILLVPLYIAAVSPFVVFWDYKWLASQRIQGSQVEGLREYRELQFIILFIRFFAWGVCRSTNNPLILSWSAIFSGILSLVVFSNPTSSKSRH